MRRKTIHTILLLLFLSTVMLAAACSSPESGDAQEDALGVPQVITNQKTPLSTPTDSVEIPVPTSPAAVESTAVVPAADGSSNDGPATDDMAIISSLPDLGPAPEIFGDSWINSVQPLRLADLENKVVLVDMWSYG